MNIQAREIRFEMLRPAQLNAERARCALVFLPVGPLEYHGPHLPVGTDPLVASNVALEACRRLGKGVVMPALFWGTERERPGWMLESLGMNPDSWVVGMDFPTATWKSQYAPEHVFGLVVATQLEMLIACGYRVIVLVNGHGATNHLLTLERLSRHYSATTPCLVTGIPPVQIEPPEEGFGGHADRWETSLLLHLQAGLPGPEPVVDLSALPPLPAPIHYHEYSVVDGHGFSRHPDPQKIVRDDPRNATARDGAGFFDDSVRACIAAAEAGLKAKGLLETRA
jgi:creatinine amidohydrolase